MCDVCTDLLGLLQSHDERVQEGNGLHLSKGEVITVILFVQAWHQRQCSCCFKEVKNFERLNNIVQVILNLAIKFMQTLPADYADEIEREAEKERRKKRKDEDDRGSVESTKTKPKQTEDEQSDEKEHKNADAKTETKNSDDDSGKDMSSDETSTPPCVEDDPEAWNTEEKDRLLQFVSRVFLMNFPLYVAYKHTFHMSLEELSQQEASALNNYCELSDPELPVFMLRNVCFFCDCNGPQAMQQCFESATPETLPIMIVHTLITIISNLRLWMNIPTVIQHIVPQRTHIIRYMCKLSDKDLRMAGTRNLTDLMWPAVREPLDTHIQFDKEGLELAFKYFTCSTLTIRLAGITQINNQINAYNDVCSNETIVEADSVGAHLATWLIEKKIIQHIFGPNLHVELIKQSQTILNFLAVEGRITDEHLDCIWAAGQLKHCSKQVHETLIVLIKNLEPQPVKHLLKLVSSLEPSAHTEQTLYLANALIKCLWATAISQNTHAMMAQQAYERQCMEYSRGRKDKECGESIHPAEDSENSGDEGVKVPEGRGKKRKIQEEGIKMPKPGHGKHISRRGKKHGADSDNSSLCANSDLSNISDESLPSDTSDNEENRRRHQMNRHQMARHHVAHRQRELGEIVHVDDSESDSEAGSHCHHHHHGHHHHHHTSSGESSEEEDDEYYDSDEEEALLEHVKMVSMHHHHHHRHHHAESTDGSSDEDYDEEVAQAEAARAARAYQEHVARKRVQQAKRHIAKARARNGRKKTLGVKRKGHAKRMSKSNKVKEGHKEEEVEEKENKKPQKEEVIHEEEMVLGNTGEEKEKQTDHSTQRTEEPSISPDHKSSSRENNDKEKEEKNDRKKVSQKEDFSKKDASPEHKSHQKDQDAGQKEQNVSQKEKVVCQKEHDVSQKEHDVSRKEHGVSQKEHDVSRKEHGVSRKEHDVSRKEHDVSRKEQNVNQKNTDVRQKEEIVSQKDRNGSPKKNANLKDVSEKSVDPDTSMETEVYDHSQLPTRQQMHAHSSLMEDILSPDEGSCNSSHVSTKSEKNMADFDGEDLLSEEELIHINAGVALSSHQMQQHLASMASVYQTQIPQGPVVHAGSEGFCSVFNTFDDVCDDGNTLLWDLVQDDKVHNLPEGLAVEAEKALSSLVCYCTDRRIRMKFIEACIENVANHRSVVVSLRLLPKIFSSFQQYRSGIDTHTVTMWAETELNMMKHFFNNLSFYTKRARKGQLTPGAMYSFKEEIIVMLQFLTCVFSMMGSPDNFRLSLEQVDTLWRCLVIHPDVRDDCLNWFLTQAKSKDHHAMGLETLKYLFLEKMPQLQPEVMSMTGLNLFQQLCHLARLANPSMKHPLSEDQVCGMDQLWGIALRAQNTDVSITAVQYLNNYYINYGTGQLEKEEEFISRCMDRLLKASENLEQSPESSLLVIQRGLILLKNHLDGFRKRYAFHLRNWQLDGCGLTSHQKSLQEKSSSTLRVVLQPAGLTEKMTLEMLSTDLVGELRAEVTRCWESLQKQQQKLKHGSSSSHSGSVLTPILGAMLGDGPIRMLTLGQELTVDMDEKSLGELQIKDMQVIFVSVGASRPPRKHDGSTPISYLTPPPRDKLPMTLLSEEPHFGHLFRLLKQLSNLHCQDKSMDLQDKYAIQSKAKLYSRKVWELLMLLPTNTKMLEGFKSIVEMNAEICMSFSNWNSLLDPHHPQKLMYSLQIVKSLARTPKFRRKSMIRSGGGDSYTPSTDSETSVEGETAEEVWSRRFIAAGGLRHLFSIFLSGRLQTKDEDGWNEWDQECLAYLLRLVTQFAVDQSEIPGQDDVFISYESPRKRLKKSKGQEKIIIPKLNKNILDLMEIEAVLKILMSILYDAALPCEANHSKSGSWGRAEVVHYAMSFLLSWGFSCPDVQPALCNSEKFSAWLRRLILEAPEPNVRLEACRGLYRLCLGQTVDGSTCHQFLLPVCASLLTFLDEAQKMKPLRREVGDIQKEKEPYGPACRDYFWLTCRLVDSLSKDDTEKSDKDFHIDLDDLAVYIQEALKQRDYHETRFNTVEDDGLIGLINLATSVIKHNPLFKTSDKGKKFLTEIFGYLFELPSTNARYLPKCKSMASRSGAYDLLVELAKGNLENYTLLHEKMMQQHTKKSHAPYPWDYWPHEDIRSNCGYVGLTNLGATCYMATCMQHLYMIPQARQSVLQAKCTTDGYEGTLKELQKMFAYLMESERKAYNPRSFCKVYTMDKQPLNTGEQKDMTEFFTDLISKLEDMSPELKKLVKNLFGGELTNNVISLDCPHVSRTLEEFYTVRCQVADMKNLYESLDEVTVKDTLEGDNMYTCSKCQKKVRAEKRACFKTLPQILCFNTMRYTFNMITMMKEKVNTHFSFPLRLDMSPYMEENLMGPDKLRDKEEDICSGTPSEAHSEEGYEYELNGVTVHTGTADGGHYYSFIRDRTSKSDNGQDKWYLFNDAEVKPFDPAQIASECFGGEMTSKTYDSMTDKFMDFSFEKTNSAYMLFYERVKSDAKESIKLKAEEDKNQPRFNFELSKELAEWIWEDNMQFIQDKNLLEHTYFGFLWQMCGYLPTTLPKDNQQVPLMAAKLSTSFVLETLIHAKEKPTMLQWIELLTKQFNSCPAACEWFLDAMAIEDWWPQQILIKCPNQTVRQMFQRLLIHVITQLRQTHAEMYLHPAVDSDEEVDVSQIGNKSCVTRFIKKMLAITEQGVRPSSKYLTEYFSLLLEFAKMGEEEKMFMLNIGAISTLVNFYMGQKSHEYVEILSDDEDDDDVIPVTEDKYRPPSLDKMIQLIAMLVESARGEDNTLQLLDKDFNCIVGGKGFPFLFSQIRDNINLRQTCNLIFSLCRWNERMAVAIIQMVFSAIMKLNSEFAQPFFKLLSLLVEFMGVPPGMPPFTQYILQKFWDLAEYCPQQCLDWLSTQVVRNKLAHSWVLRSLDDWVERYLLAYSNVRVRNAAACLLVSLVPSPHFRQAYRSARSILSPHKEIAMNPEAVHVLHEVYQHLLRLLNPAKLYVDASNFSTTQLMSYFALMTYCLVSKTEKLMFSPFFGDLWNLFQPKLSEPPISTNLNKQALLIFWYQVCNDCPENVSLITSNPQVTKNIAFNYILADHEDQEVVLFNRCMLPAYYGILRMCCQQSRTFTRQLAQHQNIQWAFKNITPFPAQYTAAVEELFRIMRLMATKYSDSTEEEVKAINHFRRVTRDQYLEHLDPRSGWQTLIMAMKILVESHEECMLTIFQNGLIMLGEAFNVLHVMYHEATACHVTQDIVDLLGIIQPILKVAKEYFEKKNAEVKSCLHNWKDRMDLVRKLLTMLNSYTPPEIRQLAIDVLREMVLLFQSESLQTIVPVLSHAHSTFQENSVPVTTGPYFPHRGQKPSSSKSNIRPPRPQFQMMLQSNQLEAGRGVDDAYDAALTEFFHPYYGLVDLVCRVAVNQENMTEMVINLSAMVAYEGVPIHSPFFAKLWYEIYHSEHVDKNCIKLLCRSSFFIDYIDAVLLDERQSLNNQTIYQFMCSYFPKVYQNVMNDQGRSLLDSLVTSITSERLALEKANTHKQILTVAHRLNGDLRAMLLIFSVQPPKHVTKILQESLEYIYPVCKLYQRERVELLEQQRMAEQRQEEARKVKMQEQEEASEVPSKKRKLSFEKDENEKEKTPDNKQVESPGRKEDNEKKDQSLNSDEKKENIPKPDAKSDGTDAETGIKENASGIKENASGSKEKATASKEKATASKEKATASKEGYAGSSKEKCKDNNSIKDKDTGESSKDEIKNSETGKQTSIEKGEAKHDEPQPSTSKGKSPKSKDGGSSVPSGKGKRVQKEKPNAVDLVVRNIECIFNIIKKKESDTQQETETKKPENRTKTEYM